MMRTSRWLLATYAAIIFFGIVAALPNLFSQPTLAQLPGWLPTQQVTLGLDLRGGSHMVLEVDARALIQERLQGLFGEARRALREAGIDTRSVQRRDDGIIVILKDGTRQADAVRALRRLAAPVGMMSFGAGSSDLTVATAAPEEIRLSFTEEGVRDRVDAAVEQSLEIIRQRIDQVGVAEPTISASGPIASLCNSQASRSQAGSASSPKMTVFVNGGRRGPAQASSNRSGDLPMSLTAAPTSMWSACTYSAGTGIWARTKSSQSISSAHGPGRICRTASRGMR
jgi:preprotein translocase subunit SecD